MCRWLAYSGDPVFLDELIFKPEHSLIEQSRSSYSSTTPTNADGYGVGWYGERATPGLYRSIRPAWNDRNLGDLAGQIRSGLFLAHVRAATGTPVQQTNCHPFRHGRWLFVHNGVIRDFLKMKRDLVKEVSSELLVERVGREHGVEHPLGMTLGISDGSKVFAIRYASDGKPRTLFHSKDMRALKELNPRVEGLSDDARAVVSEPFGDLSEYWVEIRPSSSVIIDGGGLEIRDFDPRE